MDEVQYGRRPAVELIRLASRFSSGRPMISGFAGHSGQWGPRGRIHSLFQFREWCGADFARIMIGIARRIDQQPGDACCEIEETREDDVYDRPIEDAEQNCQEAE